METISSEQLMILSLTLPQVAATLAATLVAHQSPNAAGQRLLDDRMLNVVLVQVFYNVRSGFDRAVRNPRGGGTTGRKPRIHTPGG